MPNVLKLQPPLTRELERHEFTLTLGQVVLVRHGLRLDGIEAALDYGRLHKLHRANTGHLLALARAVPNLREAMQYSWPDGPGLFATEPITSSNGPHQAFCLWCPGPNLPPRAKVLSYRAGCGPKTFYLFTTTAWQIP